MNNLYFRFLLAALLIGLCNFSSSAQADTAVPPTYLPEVAIMKGAEVVDQYIGVRVTGESSLKILQVVIRPSSHDRGLSAQLTTDRDILPAEQKNLVVKVKEKLFVALPLGPGPNHLWLSHIDEESADILANGKLAPAPHENFNVKFALLPRHYQLGHDASMQPVLVKITVTNTGKKTLQLLGAKHGRGDYPGYNMRLSARGTYNNRPIESSLSFLSDGSTSPLTRVPLTIKPNATLEKTVDLRQWLILNQPGTYQIDLVCTLYLINPKFDGLPQEWAINYPAHLNIELRR